MINTSKPHPIYQLLAHIIKKHWIFLVFILSYFSLTLYKLVLHVYPFYDWDESIYAEVGKEMVNKHSLVPLWQGQVWLDKPPFVPFFYGLIEKSFFFIKPEISTRVATLFLSCVVLTMIYFLFYKASKNLWIAILTTVTTAFTQIFMQRAQVLNIDLFLLLGWAGYMLFFDNFIVSFLFLSIAVLSKSLVGFYPAFIVILFQIYRYKKNSINKKFLIKFIKLVLLQVFILIFWYLIMYIFFGNQFIKQQIVESHFKRITASIESHFGKRTYYLDLIWDQFGILSLASFISFGLIFINYRLKKLDDKNILYAFFLLPWFLFLNLTKTKIFWYVYPAISQFAFLIFYPLVIFSNNKKLINVIGFLILGVVVYYSLIRTNFFSYYSSLDSHHIVAEYAQKNCSSLVILVDPQTRNTTETLEKMDLLITTSKWWGNHPSMVFYFGKKIDFNYNKAEFIVKYSNKEKNTCFVIDKTDIPETPLAMQKGIFHNGSMYLFK